MDLVEKLEIKRLKFIGIDDWSRPVYRDEKGSLYKDVGLGEVGSPIQLCTSVNNEFDGEPDRNVNFKFSIVTQKKELER